MTAAAGKLYTPDILALAVGLAAFPLSGDLPLRGSARSRSCGSSLELGLSLDSGQRVGQVGIRASACAIGQAAASIFANAAAGMAPDGVIAAQAQLAAWLAGTGELPDWPGIEALIPARDYPGRHGAIMLAWNAACSALSNPPPGG